MKKLLFLLFLVISSQSLFAIGIDTVTLKLYLQEGFSTTLVSTGKINEGQPFTIPAKTLDGAFAKYQYYYDAIAGGKFYLEEGSIDSNITINILMNVPKTIPFMMGKKKIWFLGDIEVEGNTLPHYRFKNGKAACFEFYRTPKFDSMVTKLGFQVGATWKFAYFDIDAGSFNSLNLYTINNPFNNSVLARITHFSTIGAGDDKLTQASIGTDTVTVNLYLQKGLSTTLVGSAKINEGQEYVIPNKTLTGDFASYQYYLDAIAGGVFYLEDGAIDSNITINALINVPKTVPWTVSGKKLWFLGDLEVAGTTSYNFKTGKAAVFEFPRTTQFDNMVNLLGFVPGKTWQFAYYDMGAGTFNAVGIYTINDTLNNQVVARITHFSSIGAGDDKLAPTNVDQKLTNIPRVMELNQNYPNPFNPTTNIKYSIPAKGWATLKVYDILGNQVAVLFDGIKEPGSYNFSFDASRLTSGVYVYKLDFGGSSQMKKMILVK